MGRQRPLDKIKSKVFSVSIVFCTLCPRCLIVFYSHSISVFLLYCATELPTAKKERKNLKPKNKSKKNQNKPTERIPDSFPLIALKHIQLKTVTLRRDFASTSLSRLGEKQKQDLQIDLHLMAASEKLL